MGAEPTVPVREMVDLIVEQWNRGLEADEALRLLLPLMRRVLNSEPSKHPSTLAPYEQRFEGAPYEQGEEVWTRNVVGRRRWFVDQMGAWVEDAPDETWKPVPLVQQAWHGDDANPVQAPPVEVNKWGLTSVDVKVNQERATALLASGEIIPAEVGAVVNGQHPRSAYKATRTPDA